MPPARWRARGPSPCAMPLLPDSLVLCRMHPTHSQPATLVTAFVHRVVACRYSLDVPQNACMPVINIKHRGSVGGVCMPHNSMQPTKQTLSSSVHLQDGCEEPPRRVQLVIADEEALVAVHYVQDQPLVSIRQVPLAAHTPPRITQMLQVILQSTAKYGRGSEVGVSLACASQPWFGSPWNDVVGLSDAIISYR